MEKLEIGNRVSCRQLQAYYNVLMFPGCSCLQKTSNMILYVQNNFTVEKICIECGFIDSHNYVHASMFLVHLSFVMFSNILF